MLIGCKVSLLPFLTQNSIVSEFRIVYRGFFSLAATGTESEGTAESEDRKLYRVEVASPRGLLSVPMRVSLFPPLQNGNLTVLRADVVEILEYVLAVCI